VNSVRVLLLEDQPADAELVERELRRSGLAFTITQVSHERQFREALLDFAPDVVLADYHLPGFDGLAALELVRATAPELPFIFVSGSIGEERAVEALRLGATDYVLKDRLGRIRPAIDRAIHERQIRHQLEQEKRVSSLGRIAATMAHEFNNVLMGIQPFAEVLARHDDPKLKGIAEHIRRSLQRGKGVTQEILRFTHDSDLRLEPLEISSWLHAVAPELRGLLGQSVLQLDIGETSDVVLAESSSLQQVITNLVINARDAMPAGGTVTIRARRVPSSEIEGCEMGAREVVKLSVLDTGHGMSPEVRERIFEPLFTTKRGGNGLGLPVALQIVRRHHGVMLVESATGEGTAFHLLLPASAEVETRGEAATVGSSEFRRALLVEDDPDVADATMMMLEALDLRVEHVTTGARALAALEQSVPDVVLLDLGLPDQNGFSVRRRIQARWPDLPVVFASGHVAESHLASEIGGRTTVLTKPYSLDELSAAFARLAKV
jgi:two-component system cell cycle sensor histidine kinase/response regulator CckA